MNDEQVANHPWSEAALFNKAVLYVERMESAQPEDDRYGFWSALSLELLARAALARISPVLLADEGEWRNVAFALGLRPASKRKASPTSAGTAAVLLRLKELVPGFTEELAGFCTKHANRRNLELHTGDEPFVVDGNAGWLARYYKVCAVLLESMGKELDALFGSPEVVQEMIHALDDEAAKSVKQSINARKQVWAEKDEGERGSSTTQAELWATREAGHRVRCPSCECLALVHGTPYGPAKSEIKDEEVIQRQPVVPTTFQCVACGLKIRGLSKLSACGLGGVFTATTSETVAEFYGLYTQDELEEARGEWPVDMEPDFND